MHGPSTGDDGEMVPIDDAVIGRVFRHSMMLLGVLGAVAVGVWWFSRKNDAPNATQPAIVTPAQTREGAPMAVPVIRFSDITQDAGIAFVRENGATGERLLPETMGGGCAFLDYDSDDDQDILLVNGAFWPNDPRSSDTNHVNPTLALFANDGKGQFTDTTKDSGLERLAAHGMGVAIGDCNGDGEVDVFATAVGRNHLFINQDGYFTDATETAGVGGDADQWGTSAGFFDCDNDGDLDLFVCRYVQWSREIDFAVNYQLTGVGRAYGPPKNFQGVDNVLYRNNGDGTFTDVSAQAGIQVRNPATQMPMGKALGVLPIDMDGDGSLDLFVANDTVQKFLFHNNGTGVFEEVGARWGTAFGRNGEATGAMGIDGAHYRNDTSLGVAIGNFANEMSSLFVSQGQRTMYADEAITEGIGAPTRLVLTFGVCFADFDLDGRLDLLQANGHIEDDINRVQASQQYAQPAQLFWNAGTQAKERFVELPADHVGDLARPIVGRGAAYADIDADGDLDVLLTQPRGAPLLLRNNQLTGHHWVRIRLRDPLAANHDAIGATIELSAGGVTQRRMVMPTRSYLSQVELPVTFGIGDETRVNTLHITWPDGAVQVVKDVTIDSLNIVYRKQ